MKRIVTDARVPEYVSRRIGIRLREPLTALGIELDGEIVAGVVFNDFNEHGLEVTVAGEPRAFTRAFIRRIGHYVFDELKCLRVTITTHQEHVIDLAHRLGAQTEGRKRNHFGKGVDGIILGILPDEWKF